MVKHLQIVTRTQCATLHIMPNEDTQIHIRVSKELKQKLIKEAEKDRRTLSDWIRLKVEEIVKKAKP